MQRLREIKYLIPAHRLFENPLGYGAGVPLKRNDVAKHIPIDKTDFAGRIGHRERLLNAWHQLTRANLSRGLAVFGSKRVLS
jgi:hypothetical protein